MICKKCKRKGRKIVMKECGFEGHNRRWECEECGYVVEDILNL